MEEKTPKVFISYSHDSKDFQDRILAFSNQLRKEGIDANIDQYIDSPPEGWPKWMERNIQEADFVLVVCTKNYKLKTMGELSGNGINWETSIVYQHLYNNSSINNKFIPIITANDSFDDILTPLQGSTYYNIDDQNEYDSLYWRLRGINKQKPELGKLRELPEKERKTLFISGLIEPDLWVKAKWKNIPIFLFSDSEPTPPVMLIIFENLEVGTEIFKHLINKVGEKDKSERLRISIVEGEVPNQNFGYFVVIGENISVTNKILDKSDSKNIEYILVQQQIHRMHPPADSPNLTKFKEEFAKHKCYYIAPAIRIFDKEKGYGYKIEWNYKILKKEINFRNYDDIIDENDPEIILKNKDVTDNKF